MVIIVLLVDDLRNVGFNNRTRFTYYCVAPSARSAARAFLFVVSTRQSNVSASVTVYDSNICKCSYTCFVQYSDDWCLWSSFTHNNKMTGHSHVQASPLCPAQSPLV